MRRAAAYELGVGGLIDPDQLSSEITESLGSEVFFVEQHYTQVSWGGDASALEILVGVLTVTDIALRLIEKYARQYVEGSSRSLNSETAASMARRSLARFLHVADSEIEVNELEPVGDGFRLQLSGQGKSFVAEVERQGLTRLRKTS